MKTKLYLMNALSNLHVGNGEVNYGVIDNLIQRDPVTEIPNINSSSLKGALREFFQGETYVAEVFGSEPKDTTNKQQGKFRFFEANLLSLPVRSNKRPYLMATSIDIIRDLIAKIELFGCSVDNTKVTELKNFETALSVKVNDILCFSQDLNDACVEEVDWKAKCLNVNVPATVKEIFGDNLIIVMSSEKFKKICDNNHLPVIARNNLENGQSTNLWYEQVLPRYSQLYFVVMEDGSNVQAFETKLTEGTVQVGANASIGYGFCKISDVLNK